MNIDVENEICTLWRRYLSSYKDKNKKYYDSGRIKKEMPRSIWNDNVYLKTLTELFLMPRTEICQILIKNNYDVKMSSKDSMAVNIISDIEKGESIEDIILNRGTTMQYMEKVLHENRMPLPAKEKKEKDPEVIEKWFEIRLDNYDKTLDYVSAMISKQEGKNFYRIYTALKKREKEAKQDGEIKQGARVV